MMERYELWLSTPDLSSEIGEASLTSTAGEVATSEKPSDRISEARVETTSAWLGRAMMRTAMSVPDRP